MITRRQKRDIVKAILTRLKPNVYIETHPYWKRLESGLWKMPVESIDALEGLIMGQKIMEQHQEEIPES